MKVLIQSRKDFYSLAGGDTIQLTKTAEQLKKLGIDVDISLELEPDLSEYDIIHLSNLTRIQETYIQLLNAKKYNKPIVLSTIYWPMDEFESKAHSGIRGILNKLFNIDQIERIKAFIKLIVRPNSRNKATLKLITVGYTKMQREVLENVDYFLPNAEIEMKKLMEYYSFTTDKYTVIPNSIDKDIALSAMKKESNQFLKYKDAVICVGRIDPRKNQLKLVKAMDGTKIKLLLVGKVNTEYKKYFSQIETIMKRNENFYYEPFIKNDDMYQLYKVCKVNVLPSWLDTPGLVNLEAGVMGCNLAITNRGSTEEYFGKFAEYCSPDNEESIKTSVLKAFEKPKNDKLKDYIINNFTWNISAEKTYEVYKKVLNSRMVKK